MSETDRRLKDHLNTNQAKRERMCLEILSVQFGYSDIVPRLPKGGPDGGRDMQGRYKDSLFFGAVGFVNDASDTDQHRNQIVAKFNLDLENARQPKKDIDVPPSSFVFFTNVSLTPNKIYELQRAAIAKGFSICEVFDRERIRIILDSNRGYAIRFRYLDIPLNDAEQKDFFSAWADEINSMIGSGLRGIDQTTKRIQFLLEGQLPLDHLATIVRLDDSIWTSCRGEFFFQSMVSLRIHSEGLLGFFFGGGTELIRETPQEWEAQGRKFPKNGQYGFGFCKVLPDSPQLLRRGKKEGLARDSRAEDGKGGAMLVRTAKSSGILEVNHAHLYFNALSEPWIERLQPTCKLIELHHAMVLFDCNREIASHIKEIIVLGGGYELLKLGRQDLIVQESKFERLRVPNEGKHKSESHEWATLRPRSGSSCFMVDLMGKTPRRYDWEN